MKAILFNLFILSAFGVPALAQIEVARKVNEIGVTTDGDIKKSVQDIRDVELNENPSSKLFIINYGHPKAIGVRLRQLEKAFIFLGLERKKIEFARSVANPILLTEFWIVPEKAEYPKPTKYAEKVDEVGVATDAKVKMRILQFMERMGEKPNSIAYFINYGSKKQIAIRVKHINKSTNIRMHDRFRLIIVDAGYAKTLKTELWISESRESNK